MATREAIVACARSWMGTRWHHQAYRKGVGTDCLGLIAGVAVELGLPGGAEWEAEPKYHSYGRTPTEGLLIEGADKFLDRIPVHTAKLADILVYAFKTEPQHFALISNDDPERIIHAYIFAKQVVEQGSEIPKARRVAAYRYRGIECS